MMSEAQRRRELADKLDKSFGINRIGPCEEAADLLRSDVTALEALGVEPVVYMDPNDLGEVSQRDTFIVCAPWYWHEGLRYKTPLYGPDVALRLSEALAEVERLKAALLEGERALDLSQSLLEQSTHHPTILAAYKAVRSAYPLTPKETHK